MLALRLQAGKQLVRAVGGRPARSWLLLHAPRIEVG
jgi:hypothetical protein